MADRNETRRGFTLIELAVALGIAAVLVGLAAIGLQALKPRAGLSSNAAQLTALMNAARQNALATGHDTVVMIFPQFQNPSGGTGRVVLYEDGAFSFFSTTATPNFSGFSPSDPAVAGRTEILETLDLPRDVTFGLGSLPAPSLGPPFNLIAAGICSFCQSGGDGRGAVVFDPRGRARFYQASGAPLPVMGGTVALQGPAGMAGYRMVVITTGTGSVKAFNSG